MLFVRYLPNMYNKRTSLPILPKRKRFLPKRFLSINYCGIIVSNDFKGFPRSSALFFSFLLGNRIYNLQRKAKILLFVL